MRKILDKILPIVPLAFCVYLIYFFYTMFKFGTAWDLLNENISGDKIRLLESSNLMNIPTYVHNSVSSTGSILCGIFTAMSAVLLWITFSAQREQNEKQSIEKHFYKMLEIARENSNNISSKGKTGREVFFRINNEFEDLYNIILPILERIFKENKYIIQITWILLFYGMDSKMKLARDAEIRKILSAKLPNEQEQQSIITSIDNQKLDKKRYGCMLTGHRKYDGYQSILAHYYRHLYQIVVYINKQDILSYDEKYGYIKTLRAQLNVFELILLFYNTLSPYGRTWEPGLILSIDVSNKTLDNYKKALQVFCKEKITKIECDTTLDAAFVNDLKRKTKKNFDINSQLITKYQFFRNATMPLLDNKIRISDFYPMINYENAADSSNGAAEQEVKKLQRKYK